MLYIALLEEEQFDGGDAEDQPLGRQGSALGPRGSSSHVGPPATPSLHFHDVVPAPSVSCFSLELQASYEAALEKSLALSLLRIEEKLAVLRADQPLLRPRGMELAPYRPLGTGMQEMAERSLICEWALFHNFGLPCHALLSGAGERCVALERVPSRQALPAQRGLTPPQHMGRLPRSPALRRPSLLVDGEPLQRTTAKAPPPGIESAYGGHFDPSDDSATEAVLEETLADDTPCALDLSPLAGVLASDEELLITATWRQSTRRAKPKKRRPRGSPLGAICEEATDVLVNELWAGVVPHFKGLVPPHGIAAAEQPPRSSTANSVETDSTAKASVPLGSGRANRVQHRPHTGEPRPAAQRWVVGPGQAGEPSAHPLPQHTGDGDGDFARDEAYAEGGCAGGCGAREAASEEEEEDAEAGGGVCARRSREGVAQGQADGGGGGRAEPKPAEKRKKKSKGKKRGSKQTMRLDEYVLEQNRLFQQGLSPYAQDARGSIDSDLTLPPLYHSVPVCTNVGEADVSSPVPSDDLEAPVPKAHHSHGVAQLDATSPSESLSGSPLDVALPLLSGVPVPVAGRYDWPVRAQTAIPSHARVVRMHQQYLPQQ